MANFDIAWSITAKHEGSKHDTTKDDTGNYYKGVLYGSKYGITAKFLIEQCKIKPSQVTYDNIHKLTEYQAGQYAKIGTWDKVMKGDEFANQEVANLVFDWIHQRPGTAIRLIGKVFYQTNSDIKEMLNRLKLSDNLIADINKTNPAWAYVGVQQARYKFTTESGVYKENLKGVKTRVESFKAYTIKNCILGRKVGKVLSKDDMCSDDSYLEPYFFGMPKDNEDIVTVIGVGIGLYVLYRIFK